MANEFKITQNMTYERGQVKDIYQPTQFQLPQTTQGFLSKVVTVTTSTADLSLTGVTTPGRFILQSLEATTTGNFVTWGPKTSTGGLLPLGKLGPKDSAMLYMNSTTTIRWAADTASVNVLVKCYEV